MCNDRKKSYTRHAKSQLIQLPVLKSPYWISKGSIYKTYQFYWPDKVVKTFQTLRLLFLWLLLRPPTYVGKPLCFFRGVLFWHTDSNIPDGRETPHQTYIGGLILGWTRKIHSDISFTLPLVFKGQKVRNSASIYYSILVAFDALYSFETEQYSYIGRVSTRSADDGSTFRIGHFADLSSRIIFSGQKVPLWLSSFQTRLHRQEI